MADETTAPPSWLAPHPRKYLPADLVVTGWEDIAPVYHQLEQAGIDTEEELINWLLWWSETRGVVEEFITGRYVDMTCATDDEEKKNAYLAVVREMEPKLVEAEDRLNRKYREAPMRKRLPIETYEQLDRMISIAVDLFTEENIPLAVKLSELSQTYQEITGAMTVTFRGEERTMQQMGVYLREPDRKTREEAYRATLERRLADRDRLEDIFDEMVSIRHEFARNLNLSDYREYSFLAKLRDYTPEDCETFHDAIEKTSVPLARKVNDRRREEMKLASLAPWDTACDPYGRPPLRPFVKSDELAEGVGAIFREVDPRLGDYFSSIRFSMDLDSRKGKAPGGYQTTYAEQRIPFIFTNAVGLQDDVNTLLHEGGHAFHTIACRDNPLIWYRHAAMEFSEVASMSMELVGGDRLDPFYKNEEDRKRAKRERLESIVDLFGWVARVDAFQSFIYTNPDHTRKERADKWLELANRFESGIDWSGVPEEARRYQWHRQLHIFEVPFYYVEYAIAQIGALQIYRNYRRDPEKAINDYLAALGEGGQLIPAKLFEKAGIRFDFSADLLGELMGIVEEELEL